MAENLRSTHYRACNLCEAVCGLAIEVEGPEILSIRGDRDDPLSRGHICPKAVALQDIHDDPDRLRRPVRRTGDTWATIAWSEAFDEVAAGIRSVQRERGRDAVAVYLGNPNVHSWGALLYGPDLIRCLRTANRYSATSVDQLPHHVAATLLFGHKLLLPVPDIDRTAYLLLLGSNPVVSGGSMMTAPGFRKRLDNLRLRGGQVVVVDPRRTETARIADRHLSIRPGSDALLLAALLHVVFEEGLDDLGSLSEHVDSLDSMREAVRAFSPEAVSSSTAVDPDSTKRIAREFAAAPTAVCHGRMGVSTQRYGGLCQWLINVLNIVTGNLDRPGGAMFTRPAVDLVATTGRGRLGRRRSRVRGLPEFGGELPVAALSDEILTEGPGQVRALITIAGNPVLSTPNGSRLDSALADLEFMAAVDFYINETTRHADIILPPTAALERDHYDLVFNMLAVRNVARYSPALFDPGSDARHDWQILEALRRRLDDDLLPRRLRRRLNAVLGPRKLLDLGLKTGPYGSGLFSIGRGLDFQTVEAAEHGLDLGALEPCLPGRLRTDDRRIDLAPAPYVEDLDRLLGELDRAHAEDELVLIGRRHLRSNNSWMHQYARLMGGKPRCTLLMHPDDARRLGLEDGGRVAVVSRVGRVEVVLEVSEEMARGVVSLPHGWGHDRDGTRVSTAERFPGASANDLTDENEIDVLTGSAVLNGVPVRVESAARDHCSGG